MFIKKYGLCFFILLFGLQACGDQNESNNTKADASQTPRKNTPPPPPIIQVKCRHLRGFAYSCALGSEGCPALNENIEIICDGYSLFTGYNDQGDQTKSTRVNNWGGFFSSISSKVIPVKMSFYEKRVKETDQVDVGGANVRVTNFDSDMGFFLVDPLRYEQNVFIDDMLLSISKKINADEYGEIRDVIDFKNKARNVKSSFETGELQALALKDILSELNGLNEACEKIDPSQLKYYERYVAFSCSKMRATLQNQAHSLLSSQITERRQKIDSLLENITSLSKEGKHTTALNQIKENSTLLRDIEEHIEALKKQPYDKLQELLAQTELLKLSKTKFDAEEINIYNDRPDLLLEKIAYESSDLSTPYCGGKSKRDDNTIYKVDVSIDNISVRKNAYKVKLDTLKSHTTIGSHRINTESTAITQKVCCVDRLGWVCERVLLWCSDGYNYTYRETIGYSHEYSFVSKPTTINFKVKSTNKDTSNLFIKYFGHYKGEVKKCVNGDVEAYGHRFYPSHVFLMRKTGDREEIVASNMKHGFAPRSYLKSSIDFQRDYKQDLEDMETEHSINKVKEELEAKYQKGKRPQKLVSFELTRQKGRTPKYTGSFIIEDIETAAQMSYKLKAHGNLAKIKWRAYSGKKIKK